MYSTKIGVLSALILCFLPAFTAYSKLATLESPLMFFFALAVYAYLKMSKKNLLILGVLCGLALSSKINGVFSILLISILYASIKQGRKYVINLPKKELNITFLVRFFYCTAILTLISFATLFMIWPYLWSDTVIHFMKTFNFGNRVGNFSFNNLSLILYFLIKNPALILISAVFGAFKKRGMPLLWLLITLLSVFNTSELRYAIVIELPLAMLAAVGIFEFRFGFIKINEYVFYGLFMLYLIVQVLMVHPFYLSYYNELVGFTKGAESLGLFQLRSYWGDGIGEAIDYINHYARPYSTFQLFVIPNPLYSPVRSDLRMIPPSRMITADYVVVNFFCEHVNCSYDWANINENLGVNSSVITASNYTLIHEINAMGANMALVYKRN